MIKVHVPMVRGVRYESVAGKHDTGEVPSPVARVSATDAEVMATPASITISRSTTLGVDLSKNECQAWVNLTGLLSRRKAHRSGRCSICK